MPQFWGGFLDGKLHTFRTHVGGLRGRSYRLPALYTDKAEARRDYDDVRKVEVRVVGGRPRTNRAVQT